ncbi:hypothetical protein ACIG53_09145 [Streptomyces bauhiniae]|uniref:hypothetical protein n=1 Tax=Streptomyces bauhiniae TaxID=2340725 RepID=UPI0037D5DD9C
MRPPLPEPEIRAFETAHGIALPPQYRSFVVRLVLNGPRAGEIWLLDPDWGGFTPLDRDFHTWYTEWPAVLSQASHG